MKYFKTSFLNKKANSYKIIFSLLLTFHFLLSTVIAQCPAGDVILTTQDQVDDFIMDNPGCTNLTGSLTIGPSIDIENLNNLSSLEQITGSLIISQNLNLTDMSGLSGLVNIGVDININNNSALTSIELNDVSGSLNGNFYITNNDVLTSLAAPEMMTSILGDLFIIVNPNLTTLTGLESLVSIGNRFRITNTLANIFPDFSNLISVNTDIVISTNPNVTTLKLQNVSGSLTSDFNISSNVSLTSLKAPQNLTAVEGSLFITGNPNLIDLTGLENLTFVGMRFRITDTLEDDFPDFSNLTDVGVDVVISNNLEASYINLQNIEGSLSESFIVSNNVALTSLVAPVNLTSAGGDVVISGNTILSDFTGLENVSSIGGRLYILHVLDNNFPDFSNLTSVGLRIYFDLNPNVTSIDLHNVGGVITEGIFINRNSSLISLAAPEPLTSVIGTISIGFNPNLSNLTGFDNLSSAGTLWFSDIIDSSFPELTNLSTIGNDLVIAANSNIEDLSWISNLISVGNSLRINHNPLLSNCSIDAVCNFLPGPGTRFITANTGCCLNEPVLIGACDNSGSGGVEVCDGIDNNCNGEIDEGFDEDGDGFTTCEGDCDDTNTAINPGASEICDDVDNNCDGFVDEDYDQDGDDISDCNDNCPYIFNPDQEDIDNDGIGDACDPCNKYGLFAEEELEIEETIVHSGGVGVKDEDGEAKIDDNSVVVAVGTWVQADEVEVKDGSVVTTIIEEAADDACLPSFLYNPFDSDNDICVEEDETVILTEAFYEDIEIEEGGTLIFSEHNDIYIKEFEADENVTILFNQCTNLRIEKGFELGKESSFNSSGENVRVFAEKKITFKGRNTVYGLFYSLDDLKVKRGKSYDRNNMHGQFIGDEILVEKYTDVYCFEYEPCGDEEAYPIIEGEDVDALEEFFTLEEEQEPKISKPLTFEKIQKVSRNTLHLKVGPNPFNNTIRFSFTLTESSQMSLTIYDINGKRIKTLVNGLKDSGDYQIDWDGRDGSKNLIPNGIYYYRFHTGNLVEMKSIIKIH